MNSNLNRALTAALVAFGGVAPALAQFDYPGHCIDPTSTAPYSANFNFYYLETSLFGAGIGIEGTIAYGSQCDGASGSAPVRGRIGFTIGSQGTIQDDLISSTTVHDNFLRLTEGIGTGGEGPTGISFAGPYFAPTTGGLSFARIFVQTTGDTPTTTSYLYGSAALGLSFIGRSGRYMYTESTVNGGNVGVRCVVDVLGDAARVQWRMTNNSTAALNLGLWFGQDVALIDQDGIAQVVPYGTGNQAFSIPYVTIPGRKPLSVQERFTNTPPATDNLFPVPTYVNFSAGQKDAYGLQVVNSPTALEGFSPGSTNDQTPVDEFVFGDPTFLIDGRYTTSDPQFGDFIFNAATPPGSGPPNADAAPVGIDRPLAPGVVSYLQKWQPNTTVLPGGSRDIVAYYRSITGDSSYAPAFAGYTAVVDTPKSISTNSSDPTSFNPNPFTIRVNVDNTGGFSVTDQLVRMQSVQVTLRLPAGMHAVGSTSRTIVKTVNKGYNDATGAVFNSPFINPGAVGFVDFDVEVDPETVGALDYTVDITPQPGFSTKTVKGSINVAATPRLLVRTGANLVAPPWQFTDNSWSTILGLDLNADFQAYTWDSELQQYVTQASATRGQGYWIISKSDLGYRSLGGAPTQADDQFPDPTNFDVGGAPLIRLHRGWNLVGNPYNYAFPLGQIVGVPLNANNTSLTYSDLVLQGYTDGAFAYFDQAQRSYSFIQSATGRLQPNNGYWIYANFDFDIQFPPLYDLFIRSAPNATAGTQRFDNWKLQLSAATTGTVDSQNFVGIVRKASDAQTLSVRKAPMPPTTDAMRSYVTNGSAEMAQSLRYARGTQTFSYNVANKAAGPVTVSWPNIKQIPSNLAVTVRDTVTGKTVNARSTSGYSYSASAGSIRSFVVTVKPGGTVAQRIGTVKTVTMTKGNVKQMAISFFTSGRGGATIQVLRNGVSLGKIADDIDVNAGTNVVNWAMTGGDNLPLPNGNYTLSISATGEAGDTTTRTFAITIRR